MVFNLEDREGCDSFPRRGLTGSVCCAVVVMCMRGYSNYIGHPTSSPCFVLAAVQVDK